MLQELDEIIKKAVQHKGYSLVDIFQPCVSFNKINTFKWFKANSYYLGDDYDSSNKSEAVKKAFETDKFPLGVIYTNIDNKTFEENLIAYKTNKKPLYKRKVDLKKVQELLT